MDDISLPRRRTRLSPKARHASILDHAARLVVEEGLGAVSMDRVAVEAAIRPALMYLYFASRTALLQAILLREQQRMQTVQAEENLLAQGFEDLARRMTILSLKQAEEHGLLLERLFSEPSVGEVLDHQVPDRRAGVRYLAKRGAEALGIPRAEAEKMVDICMGMTNAAAAHMRRTGVARAAVEPLLLAMIQGAMAEAARQAKATAPD